MTEKSSFLSWFEARCERARILGFVELKPVVAHARHAAGKREGKRPVTSWRPSRNRRPWL